MMRTNISRGYATPDAIQIAKRTNGIPSTQAHDNPCPVGQSPAGKLLASYPVGGDRVTNLAWRGNSLYVTVAGKVGAIYRLDVNVRGSP